MSWFCPSPTAMHKFVWCFRQKMQFVSFMVCKTLFQMIGGVPQVIRFDNLTPAVAKMLSGGEDRL